MPIGTEPAMTVSGAAAATTMKTMAPGPSRPRSRCGPSAVLGGLAVAGGAETVVVPSIVLVESGAATLPALVGATALVLLVGWCLTQFGRRMAAVGGTYSYTAKGLGPVGALTGGWALLVGYAAVTMSALVG